MQTIALMKLMKTLQARSPWMKLLKRESEAKRWLKEWIWLRTCSDSFLIVSFWRSKTGITWEGIFLVTSCLFICDIVVTSLFKLAVAFSFSMLLLPFHLRYCCCIFILRIVDAFSFAYYCFQCCCCLFICNIVDNFLFSILMLVFNLRYCCCLPISNIVVGFLLLLVFHLRYCWALSYGILFLPLDLHYCCCLFTCDIVIAFSFAILMMMLHQLCLWISVLTSCWGTLTLVIITYQRNFVFDDLRRKKTICNSLEN